MTVVNTLSDAAVASVAGSPSRVLCATGAGHEREAAASLQEAVCVRPADAAGA